MGSSQSAQDSTGNDKGNNAGNMKQDYYKLLEVDFNAGPDEIKKAYRKKALELHPDKNVQNVEAATELFSAIQAAYEVLSDPQERAWYDSHRDQILREDDEGDYETAAREQNVTITTQELLKNFSLFSSRMNFQDDNPKGFYAVAGKIFDTIAFEEEQAAIRASSDPYPYPSFGNSTSSYESDLKPFYASWTSFVTMKSFGWEEKYRYRDAPDRRVKRLMEKENKKLRELAIREFTDTVKQFVLYIRKRDPRWLPNFQSDEERVAAARSAARDQSLRARSENAAKLTSFTEAEWSRTKDVVESDEHLTDEDTDEEEEPPRVEFECVVCNKTFKTEKQVEMHEKSKKHIKTVQQLKREMRKEGKSLGLDENDADIPGNDFGTHSNPKVDMVEAINISGPASHFINNDSDESDLGDKASKEILIDNLQHSDGDKGAKYDPDEIGGYKDTQTVNAADIDSNEENDIHARIEDLEIADHSDLAKNSDSDTKTTTPQKKLKKARRKAKTSNLIIENRCVVCDTAFESRTRLFKHIRENGHETATVKKRS